MTNDTELAMLTVLAGTFANQAAAFERLTAEARTFGIDVSPHQIDVVREAREVRLAHYFRPAIVAKLEEERGEDDTLIVLFPSKLTAENRFPPIGSDLRVLGRYAGLMQYPA